MMVRFSSASLRRYPIKRMNDVVPVEHG